MKGVTIMSRTAYSFFSLVLMVTAASLCSADQGQLRQRPSLEVTEPAQDIITLQKDLDKINSILEAVLGKDSHRQARLASLKDLATAGVEIRNQIRQTLKKDVYSFTPLDMENLRTLSKAINANQAILYRKFIRLSTKEFPVAEKKFLNQAINNILKFSGMIDASQGIKKRSTASGQKESLPLVGKIPPIPEEILMQPIIAEEKAFVYGQAASNQLTPVAMCFVDMDFFNQTGGGETALMRNVGTLKLLLLAQSQVVKGVKVYTLSDAQKTKLSSELLSKQLGLFPKTDQVLTNEKIYQIYDKARAEILIKTNPQLNCLKIRQQFGLN